MSDVELQWSAVGDIFAELIEKNQAERLIRLEQIHAFNPRLEAELKSLLSAHDSAEGFFEEDVPRLFASLAADPKFQPGERLLHFEIIKLLGEGSSAQVYMARDTELERDVALKVTSQPSREASSLAHFRIDGIVQVYSEHTLDYAGKTLRLICLQLVAGPTLAELIAKVRALPESSGANLIEVLETCTLGEVPFEPPALKWLELLQSHSLAEAIVIIGIRLAETLDQIHKQGGLHLDVKPANILMDRYGRIFLGDFNISKVLNRPLNMKVNSLGGTPRYMPPEQAGLFEPGVDPKDVHLDERVDVYALGVVLKELLEAARYSNPDLSEILSQATAADPDERTPFAVLLAMELKTWLRKHLTEKDMPTIPSKLEWIRKYPLTAVSALAVASQLVASAINISYNQLQIVSTLTVAQNEVFMNAAIIYNLICYPLLLSAAIYSMRALAQEPVQISKARRAALRIPVVIIFVISLGWLPGAWIFPRVIDHYAGPVPHEIYRQFEASIWLGWLISMTTSLTLVLFVIARTMYPKYWSGGSKQASRELRSSQMLNRSMTLVSALFPMSAALIMVWFAPADYSASDYQSFKILLLVTIGLGLVNMLIVQRVTQITDRIFVALKQPRPLD